jgi:hypothetical protein
MQGWRRWESSRKLEDWSSRKLEDGKDEGNNGAAAAFVCLKIQSSIMCQAGVRETHRKVKPIQYLGKV